MLNQYQHRNLQRGLSLVELMVGITVGLFVVAAASMMMTSQLGENRRLLVETQLQQDLRATADIISREIRRAGYSATAQSSVWQPSVIEPTTSPFQSITVTAGSQGAVEYNYKRPDNAPGPFKYSVLNGVIRTRLSNNSSEQELTDAKVLYVDSLTITQNLSDPVRMSCPKACPAPATLPVLPATAADYCWPTLAVSEFVVTIAGRAVNDAAIQRTVTARVRMRNDPLVFHVATGKACPA